MYRPCQVRGRRITQLPKTSYDGNIVQRDSSKIVHIFTEHVVTLISNLAFYFNFVFKCKLFLSKRLRLN